jgi:hypothetical protein
MKDDLNPTPSDERKKNVEDKNFSMDGNVCH